MVRLVKKPVIPTGAAHSLIVSGAVEGPPHLSLPLLLHFSCRPSPKVEDQLLFLFLPLLLPFGLAQRFSPGPFHPNPQKT
jgi:hypothetical protein